MARRRCVRVGYPRPRQPRSVKTNIGRAAQNGCSVPGLRLIWRGYQQDVVGDLKLFEPITMLRLSRYATVKSAVVYGLQGGRVSASACSAGPPWGDGGPTPPRRLAPSGSAIAKSEASVVPSGGSCTNSPGRPSAHSRCSSSRRAQCPHRPTPSRKAAHRESSASESSSARIRVTDSWSFGRSRVTVFLTTSRSISK